MNASDRKSKFQLRRIFVLITRGTMDKVLVCEFPWVVPILSEIHGSNAVEISIDELCELKGALSVITQKLRHATVPAPTLREQYEVMATTFEDNPLANPEGEYNRLIELYGMHNNVKLANVEKVYGSPQQFRNMLTQFVKSGGSIDATESINQTGPIDGAEDAGGEMSVAEMSFNELKAHAKKLGIDYPRTATRAVLEDLVLTATA